ncbi:hypothetical protein [Sorangium sp. So ce406]
MRRLSVGPARGDRIVRLHGLDRLQLCRAFWAERGIPPYTYVLRMRVARE